ncbi:unnamed protein product, partial [Adineta steineri]
VITNLSTKNQFNEKIKLHYAHYRELTTKTTILPLKEMMKDKLQTTYSNYPSLIKKPTANDNYPSLIKKPTANNNYPSLIKNPIAHTNDQHQLPKEYLFKPLISSLSLKRTTVNKSIDNYPLEHPTYV